MNKRSKRFTSGKTANSFAKKVKGEVRDLRGIPNSKSNFKVVYEKQPRRDPWDDMDQDDINEMCGFDVTE